MNQQKHKNNNRELDDLLRKAHSFFFYIWDWIGSKKYVERHTHFSARVHASFMNLS